MTRDEALTALREECHSGDIETDHGKADEILLALINDKEITEAYDAIDKWYA